MANLLSQGIQFRSLLDRLDRNEFMRLMNRIYDEYQSTLFGASMLSHLTKSSPNVYDQNMHDLNFMNSAISTIIRSRNTATTDTSNHSAHEEEEQVIALGDLPRSIIGRIASSLQQNDYFHFEQANRAMFTGCNSPNQLQELDLTAARYENLRTINLRRLWSVKHLKISVHQLRAPRFRNTRMRFLPQLHTLTLKNHVRQHQISTLARDLRQSGLNTALIKTLNIFDVVSNNLRSLLTQFPSVEYLGLFHVYFNNDAVRVINECCPGLRGLLLNNGVFRGWSNMLQTAGSRLNYLCHGQLPTGPVDVNQTDFSHLRELRMDNPNVLLTHQILETAKNVRKFHLNAFGSDRRRMTSLTTQELATVIPDIFSKCDALQYFGIDANMGIFGAVLEALEVSLFRTRDVVRNTLKIRIECKGSHGINLSEAENILLKIDRLVYRLSASEIDNFMLILDFEQMPWPGNNEDVEVSLRRNISSDIWVRAEGSCFVIMNENCAIQGWKEKWLVEIQL